MRNFMLLLLLALAGCTSVDNRQGAPGHLVSSSTAVPPLALRIDSRFEAVEPLRFPIEDLTDAERRIFIDADQRGTIRRMVIVQFEKVKPGSSFRFVFPSTPPRVFGASTYRAGAFAYDDERTAREQPRKEPGLTRSHLQALGYRPARIWNVARLARVSDPDGMGEVIVFYMENADALHVGGLVGTDEDGDLVLDAASAERLFSALASVVHIESG